MNLRGKFFTDADGHISFRSVKPAGYPIPIDGPIGDLLRAQGRHNMRPAHLHFLASKDGFKTLISQLYVPDDKFIETDVQFGVTRHLIGNYVRHENEPAPAPDVKGPWYSLDHTFVMEPGAPSCRGRRSPARRAASGRRFRIWREACAARVSRPSERPSFCSHAILRASASRDPAPKQEHSRLSFSPGPGSRFARPGHEIRRLSPRARPRARPTPRSGRTGWRAPPACGCRRHSD